MNAVVGPNPLEWILLVLLGGGYGMPQAVPPTAETPLAAKVAPGECLFYASWAGTGTPDANSGNETEQLLAEPEVQEFLTQARDRAFGLLRSSAAHRPKARQALEDLDELLKLVLGKPGAIFVSEVRFESNESPHIKGGGLLQLDDDVAEARRLLEKLQGTVPEERVSSAQLDSRPFHRIELQKEGPAITWGISEGHLVFGLGDGSLEEMLQRAGGQAPEWLTDIRSTLTVPRFSSLTYFEVERLVQIIIQQTDDPKAAQLISALGLEDIGYFANVSGMDDRGCLSRSLLTIEGRGTGLLRWIDSEPLTASEMKMVPRNAPVAVMFKLDPSWLLDLWLDVVEMMEPRAADGMHRGLDQMRTTTGIDVRKDLVASLGDTWKIFAQPGATGLMGSWAVAVGAKNHQTLERTHASLLEIVRNLLKDAGPGAPSLRTETVHGHEVHTLPLGMAAAPLALSWCLTEDQLFVTATPEAMEPLLADDSSGQSLADRPDVAALFGAEASTLALAYLDTRQVAATVLQLLPMLKQAMGPMRRQADTANLPPSWVITRHLQPSVFAVSRTDQGLALMSRRTLPGANLATSAPVVTALLLPAVSTARQAARRTQSTNNLKQLALALHNYHDTYKALPAGYSADADGKPLLSWRVHILRFVEEAELYNQFHFDEPWDSPHNKSLIEQMPDVYRAPGSQSGPGKTNYLGVSGADGVFVRPAKGNEGKAPRGTSFRQIRDGTSNTIMIVEASDESAVTWTKPADFAPNKQKPTQGLTGLRPAGFLAALADGSVHFMSESIDAAMLNAMFTKSDGEPVNPP